MTLPDLCEPLFLYVTRLNRGARKGVRLEMAQVRSDLEAILVRMRSAAADEGATALHDYEKVSPVVLYFADFTVRNSRLSFARQWRDLSAERSGSVGDEAFFDELEGTLAEPDSESARQRLAVFYTCLGLGFTGWYAGNPEYLRRKTGEVASRIRSLVDADGSSRICPEAYEHVNTVNLAEPPSRKLIGVGIALAGMAAVLAAGVAALHYGARSSLDRSIEVVRVQAQTGAPAGAHERAR